MVGLAGFDFIILDMEHGPYGIQALGPLILAARSRNLVPIARVRSNDPALVGAALDAGASGVLVPQISSAAAARDLVAAARFAPLGRRGLNPWVRAADYSAGPEWLEQTNRDTAVVAMIEGKEGIEALPAIMDVEGLDGIFLGPVDLSVSMGLGMQPEHPKVVEAVAEVVRAAEGKGKSTAVFAPTAEAVQRWLARGVQCVAVSEDTAVIAAALRELRTRIGTAKQAP